MGERNYLRKRLEEDFPNSPTFPFNDRRSGLYFEETNNSTIRSNPRRIHWVTKELMKNAKA